MPVSAQTPLVKYTANGVATVFAYTFRIILETDLEVYVGGVAQTTGFTIEGVGDGGGGTITFEEPPAAGLEVKLQRNTPRERTTDYVEGGPLRAQVLDDDLDRLWMALQDIEAQQNETNPPYAADFEVQTVTATAGQTTFTLTGGYTFTPGGDDLEVSVNGAVQISGTDYTEPNNTQITFASGLNEGDVVVLRITDLRAIDASSFDHGALTGLADDDHTQYFNTARGDARYSQLGHTHTASNITDFSTAADARIAAASINALSDVVISTPSTGQVLKYNGTNWINDTDATGAGGGGSVTSVNLTAPAAGITVSGGPVTTSGSITLALANDLAALEALSGTGFAKRTGTDTWTLDTNTYLTGNQTITLSGDVTGTGTTAITTTIGAGKVTNTMLANSSVTVGTTTISLGSSATALAGLTTLSMSGQLTSTLATGTAPFSVTSTTRVANLNVATAGTADTLTTPRTINGTAFDGSSNITVTAAAGTLTGTTLNPTVTASSLTSVGTLSSLAVTGTHTQTGAFNLAGTSSPLQVGGSAGTSGQVLTSAGAGATPTWTTISGTGTVTSVSVVSANGFAGSVATATTTPAITLSTSVTGVLKGDGTAISAATSGTDYVDPAVFNYLNWFGDGSDGNLTSSSGTTTLTRDMYYNNVTLSGTAIVDTSGWRMFVKGTLDISASGWTGYIGFIGGNGGSSATTGAGAAGSRLSFRQYFTDAGIAGKAGGATTGTNGGANALGAWYLGGAAGAAGAGGTGSSGAGGSAGTNNTPSILNAYPRVASINFPVTLGVPPGGGINAPSGGSGGGDGTAGGGSGAGGIQGGVMQIFAKTINRSSSGSASVFRATGGNGGNGGTPAAGNRGGGGAGGGAGGGHITIIYANLTGSTQTNAINVSGGAGGNGGSGSGTGTAGSGGTGGKGGSNVLINILTGAVTVNDATSTAGTGPTGATGGAGASAKYSL